MKLDLLRTICETPGWHAPAGGSLTEEEARSGLLGELEAEGWTVYTDRGWEATPEALDALDELEERDGELVRVPSEPLSVLPYALLDWSVPRPARLLLDEGALWMWAGSPPASPPTREREGMALVGGSWLFFFDKEAERWFTWPVERVLRIEWVS